VLGQVFEISDIPKLGILSFLEIILSADNAIILAIISASLPKNLQKKALFIGLISAFIFRALGIFFIALLLNYPFIQLLGAAYLIYLSAHYFIKKSNKKLFEPPKEPSFWKVVLLIEFFDLVFAGDSIIAGIAFINSAPIDAIYHPKLWIVYVGGMVGVCAIRYAAHLFTILNEKFPRLETSAHLMIGWIGLKVAFQSLELSPSYFPFIFWTGLIFLFSLGFIKRKSAF